MKLGVIARADMTGLGVQTRDYYTHLKPHKTLLVDISTYNGNEQHYGWYQNAIISKGFPHVRMMQSFLSGLTHVLTAETWYDYKFVEVARKMGVKTICAPNYEFFDYYLHPDYPKPDALFLPSMWHYDDLKRWGDDHGVKVLYMHHPVDTDTFTFIERHTNKPFHIAGKPASHDRNGTFIYLQAEPMGKVITQSREFAKEIGRRYRHSKVVLDVKNPQDIYTHGDIMVLPRRYGGNCLPLNEALARGCPVIMPDIEPNNHLLPKEWLVPARVDGHFEPRTRVELYSVNPLDLKNKIEELRSADIAKLSKQAYAIAKSISWNENREKWLRTIATI